MYGRKHSFWGLTIKEGWSMKNMVRSRQPEDRDGPGGVAKSLYIYLQIENIERKRANWERNDNIIELNAHQFSVIQSGHSNLWLHGSQIHPEGYN